MSTAVTVAGARTVRVGDHTDWRRDLDPLAQAPVPGAVRIGSSWQVEGPAGGTGPRWSDAVITRVTAATVHRDIVVTDAAGAVCERGTEVWQLSDALEPIAALNFCSPEWAELIGVRLAADDAFVASLSTWDGAIGLRCDEREIQLRIYKGRIIDVTRRCPHGATFTFIASGRAWVDLVSDADNDFMRRAIRGEFSSSGDGYEYLRLTKPLDMIVGHARAIAREVSA
ncbi:hypothetical protein GYA93_12075 [Gordonia desulfuricans]|uniref:Uncharacterized protein n=1 Tax=Gordonia desulfuricans TaxID=89051 RepID=A0A7K3LPX6_9ACTN|nr:MULTISPECIES: hypothetical protein [Gordonia]EMP10736.2 hypothetical protein ISGA_5654 [Gordonia sp. NB41Y]NDK90314.1 hypothetical protein [Gordonia desulfuricans]WLP89574.1 hypothetical protein Q9K23_18690 [Gordonia sp. NB41Y]